MLSPLVRARQAGRRQGGPRWGWRTAIEQPHDDTLELRMYNYRRVPPAAGSA